MGEAPMGFFPLVEDFIGEGGNLDWPEAVVKQNPSKARAEQFFEGFEVLGGLRFADVDLLPNESCSYILILAITKDNEHSTQLVESYGNLEKFEDGLQKTKAFWQDRLRSLVFQTGEDQYNQWLKWCEYSTHFAATVWQLFPSVSRLWPRRPRLARPVAGYLEPAHHGIRAGGPYAL